AFIAFAAVNASLIAAYFRVLRPAGRGGPIGWVALPAVGVAVNVALWLGLEPGAKIVGGLWVAAGFGYLLWSTRLFRRSPLELADPDMVGAGAFPPPGPTVRAGGEGRPAGCPVGGRPPCAGRAGGAPGPRSG